MGNETTDTAKTTGPAPSDNPTDANNSAAATATTSTTGRASSKEPNGAKTVETKTDSDGPVKGLSPQTKTGTGPGGNYFEPAEGEKPSEELSVDELTDRLAASGITLRVDDATDVGQGVKHAILEDAARPELERNTLSDDTSIVSWAHHAALRLFPASAYALTYGGPAPANDPTSVTN